MQLQDVEKLIQDGESETVEFKRSTGQRTTTANKSNRCQAYTVDNRAICITEV